MGSEDNGGQDPTMAEDNSIFDLSLDEVQSQLDSLGKPLSSMNLEELVRTVHGADLYSDNVVVAANEVSMDIQQGCIIGECSDRTTASAPRQCTLRELTLEDFLAKAGIVSEAQPVPQPPFLQCKNMVPVFMPSHDITMTSLSSPPRSAYKQQLELRLAELEQENAKLKAAEAQSALQPVTKIQLQRTRSAPPISNAFF